MQVLSRCPLEVASILWLPRSGAHTLTVVAKATFQLAPDLSQLAPEQDPVIESDSYWDHDEGKSLDSASELVPFKRQPEVLLVGHAYAPQGIAVGALIARLTVAEIDKAIDITGDRHFKLDGTLSHPGRFAKMPLRWERAAGGPETSNPVGVPMGEEAHADGWGRVTVPNLVPSGRHVTSREDVVPPACFAPIAPSWPTRVARLHRHAGTFSPDAWHARPMPPDLDTAYFNAAPQDQLLRELLGTERFTLENLHPQFALLQTRLPNVGPRATVDWGGGSTYEVPFACDTLLIDTDRGVATLTYRAHVSLDYPERQGWVIVTADVAPSASLPAWIHGVSNIHETMAVDGEAPASSALPFEEEPTQPPEAQAAAQEGGFDEEETFASVRGDAPFPAGLIAPPGKVSAPGVSATSDRSAPATPLPAMPPEVPKGPRLGAFRLAGKSEVPAAPSVPPAGEPDVAPPPRVPATITDEQTVDPDNGWMTDTADGPEAARPPLRPGAIPPPPLGPVAAPPTRSSVAGTPFMTRAAGTLPIVPEVGAGTPLEKKLPGTVAPMTPGVPPPPPPAASRQQAPTFGFRRHNTLSNVAAPPSASGMPFAPPGGEPPPPRGPEVGGSAMPFTRAQTTPTPGAQASSAMPFAPPPPPSVAGMPFTPPPSVSGTPFAPPQGMIAPPQGMIAPPQGMIAPPQGMTIGEMVAQTRAPVESPSRIGLESPSRIGLESPSRIGLEAPSRIGIEAPPTLEPESTQEVAASAGPVEPPRIGPLATPEMVASDLGIAPPEAPAKDESAAAAPAPAPAAPEPPPLPLEEYPLERCARIAASIARSREKKDEILEGHKLDDARWEPLRTHWLAEIKRETERGKTEKLRAYDAAFVAQLEDERGPIAVEEYARIVISAERGTTTTTLQELGLPEAATLRIQRVWMNKMGKDPELRRLARSAVEAASES